MKRISSKQAFEDSFSNLNIQEVFDWYITETTVRGVDGVNFDIFKRDLKKHFDLIERKSRDGTYSLSRYREKLILKGATSLPRRVSIPTIRDRLVLRCLNDFLCKVFPDCKPAHAHPVVSKAINSFVESEESDYFVKLDIRSFYDHIDHDVLKTQLKKRIRHMPAIDLIMRAVKTPTGEKSESNTENKVGVPQGLSISNILASIYMHDLDVEYGSRLDVKYHRYVDDILIRVASERAEVEAKYISRRLKKTRKLMIHPLGSGKSAIFSLSQGISYLGYHLKNRKVSVREESVKKLMTSVMRIIAGINDENANKALWRLNLRISGCRMQGENIGWLFYFSQIDDRSVLFRIDRQIQARLMNIGRFELIPSCKNLVKAHREIKYNFNNTNYVINFDELTREQMLDAIHLIRPAAAGRLEAKSDDEVKSIFFKTMYREAKEMERDTLGSFS